MDGRRNMGMPKRTNGPLIGSTLLGLLLGSAIGQAELVVALDMNTGTAGVQNTLLVGPGTGIGPTDTFDIDLYVWDTTVGITDLAAFIAEVSWASGNTVADYNGGSLTLGVDNADWQFIIDTDTTPGETNWTGNYEFIGQGTQVNLGAGVLGHIARGTFTLASLPAPSTAFTVGPDQSSGESLFNTPVPPAILGTPIPVDRYQGGTLQTVPEASTGLLFAVSLVSLWGYFRRKRRPSTSI